MNLEDKQIIDKLSEPARKQFEMLDSESQRRLLLQVKEIARNSMKAGQRKKHITGIDSGKWGDVRQKKGQVHNKESPDGDIGLRGNGVNLQTSENTDHLSDLMSGASFVKEAGSFAVQSALFLTKILNQQTAEDADRRNGQNVRLPGSSETTRKIQQLSKQTQRAIQENTRKTAGKRANHRGLYGLEQVGKRVGGIGHRVTKGVERGVKETGRTIGQAARATVKSVNPYVLLAEVLLVLLFLMLIFLCLLCIPMGYDRQNADEASYQSQVTAQTESYRPIIEKYCQQYEIGAYVDLCLAVIQQESSGMPPDVMQAEQCPYNKAPPIDSAEESIDCGVHELADCLKAAGCKNPYDLEAIKLALQGYNFGNGYISWAVKNYGGYTADNARTFSANMKAKLNLSGYGDVDYVPHVLRYYVSDGETKLTGSAESIVKELKENNPADSDLWKVIEKGASLTGKVTYSMEKRDSSGSDSPKYLDCSSFTAWAFHKAGFSNVPYASSTATFLGSSAFVDVSGELQPGDIGLKNREQGGGGINHVGIYCGALKDGTRVWLHCTSSSSTSLTGNESGVMLGSYTNFTVFRRIKRS